MNRISKKILDTLIDKEELINIGIVGEENIEKYLKTITTDLFYLQYAVVRHLMPYIAKTESVLKKISKENDSLNKAITKISKKPASYLDKSLWEQNHRKPISLDNSPYNNFIILSFLFRNARNLIMHGDSNIFGIKVSESEKSALVSKKASTIFKTEQFKSLFATKVLRSFIDNFENENPSYLSITILFLSFFIRPQIYYHIMTSIDYEIFSFAIRYKFIRKEQLYKWIGLKQNWVTKLGINNFLK